MLDPVFRVLQKDTRLLSLSHWLGVTGKTGALGISNQKHQVGHGQLLCSVHSGKTQKTKAYKADNFIALYGIFI